MTDQQLPRLCTLVPLGAQIIVKRDPPKLVSDGGIILPGDERQKAKQVQTGVVIRKGPGNWSPGSGTRMPISDDIRPGMRVMFAKYAGQDYPHEEAHGLEVYTVMQEGEVLFRLGAAEDGVPIPEGAALQEELDQAAQAEAAATRRVVESMTQQVAAAERELVNQVQGKSAGGIVLPQKG